jgi:hypothetical protein
MSTISTVRVVYDQGKGLYQEPGSPEIVAAVGTANLSLSADEISASVDSTDITFLENEVSVAYGANTLYAGSTYVRGQPDLTVDALGGDLQIGTSDTVTITIGQALSLLKLDISQLQINNDAGDAGEVLVSNGASAPTWATTPYTPSNGAHWNNPDPTTVISALDRLAAAVFALRGNVSIP